MGEGFNGVLGEVTYVGLCCPKCGSVSIPPHAIAEITCLKCHARLRVLGSASKIKCIAEIPQSVEVPVEFLHYVCEDCGEAVVPRANTSCDRCRETDEKSKIRHKLALIRDAFDLIPHIEEFLDRARKAGFAAEVEALYDHPIRREFDLLP